MSGAKILYQNEDGRDGILRYLKPVGCILLSRRIEDRNFSVLTSDSSDWICGQIFSRTIDISNILDVCVSCVRANTIREVSTDFTISDQ